jgi:hypothetical protein
MENKYEKITLPASASFWASSIAKASSALAFLAAGSALAVAFYNHNNIQYYIWSPYQ